MYRMDNIGQEVRRRSFYLGSAAGDETEEDEKEEDDTDDSGFDRDALPSFAILNGTYVQHSFQFAEGKNFIEYMTDTHDSNSE